MSAENSTTSRCIGNCILLPLLLSTVVFIIANIVAARFYEASPVVPLIFSCGLIVIQLCHLIPLANYPQRSKRIEQVLTAIGMCAVAGFGMVFILGTFASRGAIDIIQLLQSTYALIYLVFGLSITFIARQLQLLRGLQRVAFFYLSLLVIVHNLLILFFLADGLSNTSITQRGILLALLLLDWLFIIVCRAGRMCRPETLVVKFIYEGLVLIVLGAIYFASIFLLSNSMHATSLTGQWLIHFVAALLIAIVLHPFRKMLGNYLQRRFPEQIALREGAIVTAVTELLQSLTTIDALIYRYTEIIRCTFGSRSVEVLLRQDIQQLRNGHDSEALIYQQIFDSPIATALAAHTGVLEVAYIHTVVPHDASSLQQALREREIDLLIPFATNATLLGVVLIGTSSELSFYGKEDCTLLETMNGIFWAAVENALLYGELERAKSYNTMLLESLLSGIMAFDLTGTLTACNSEARRILNISTGPNGLSQIAQLPSEMAAVVDQVLRDGGRVSHREDILLSADNRLPISYSAVAFSDYRGEKLGVLLVIEDLSKIYMLQRKARRVDRLASLGTLAAGMAHEIKNPLVSIKTFTELLPLRFDDGEFREQFSTLVFGEFERIEEIVNQLLNFAQPPKAVLAPMKLHDILNDCVDLVRQKCQNQSIELSCKFTTANDQINGDAKMLRQVIVNLLLNAIDAMPAQGRLTVITMPCSFDGSGMLAASAKSASGIALIVQDTGCGISQENLARIFDPFFTTKSSGTGLGLAITYGIIQEHGGTIDVKSDGHSGTSFFITLPLHEKESGRERKLPQEATAATQL